MEVIRDGLKVIEVAERYGVSRQTVHGWLRRYASGGLDALADRSHRPDSCPHQMPAAVEARLCELRRHHPQWGQRRLAHELVCDGINPPPGLTSIYAPWSATASSSPSHDGDERPTTAAGNAAGPWSCGRWTSWEGSG